MSDGRWVFSLTVLLSILVHGSALLPRARSAPLRILQSGLVRAATPRVEGTWKLVEPASPQQIAAARQKLVADARTARGRGTLKLGAFLLRAADIDSAELGIALDDIDHFALSAWSGQEAADCSRSAMVDGCVTGSEDGRPVAPLMGAFKGKDYDGGFMFVDVGVTTNCVAYPDYGLIYRTVPLTVDKTAFELIWLVDPEAVEGRDYEVDKLIWMWDHTSLEDKKIIELNQAGVNSAFFEPGPYTPMEDDAARYIEWYIASMQKV